MADHMRFASLSEDDFSKILENKDAATTKRATVQSVSILRQYLNEKRLNDQFETYSIIMFYCLPLFINYKL